LKNKGLGLVAFGANLGDRLAYIESALRHIGSQCGPVIALSSLYETAPIGNADQTFLNGALICQSLLEPTDLMQRLLAIETELGRQRTTKWGNRTIDLDVILWQTPEGECYETSTPLLTIPHPEAAKRDFVMRPCLDIAAHWRYPKTKLTIQQICAQNGYLDSSMKIVPWHFPL
jgi:2-amino-4-hydroxy-6-hydroxymethyldihydropteridine diphosphokinase